MIKYSTQAKVLVKKDIVIKEFDYDNTDFVEVHEDLDSYGLVPKLRDVIKKKDRWLYIVDRIKNIDEPVRLKNPQNNNQYFSMLDDMFGVGLPKELNSYEKQLLEHNYTLHDFHIGNFGYIGNQIVCLDEGCFIKEDDSFMQELLRLFEEEI